MSPVPGHDEYIVDDPVSGSSANGTDTLYLLSTSGPATPTVKSQADTEDDTLNGYLRTFFNVAGKGCTVVLQGVGDGTTLPTPVSALALLPEGPGQVVAPEQVTSAQILALIEGAWPQNKVVFANGASNLADSALETLSAALIAGTDARGAALFGDYWTFPSPAGTGTIQVPAALVVAACCARNDLTQKNPNIAAAGLNGIPAGAIGLNTSRSAAAIETLKTAQVNCAKYVSPTYRNYGFRTLADLTTLPLWWDMSGTRTVMAYRAAAAAINEDFVFAEIDGKGAMLGRYQSRLEDAAKQLQDAGALYGYSVDIADVNSLADLEEGDVVAQVYLQTSPYAEHLTTNITRRDLSAAL
jgi:hypothetical protein